MQHNFNNESVFDNARTTNRILFIRRVYSWLMVGFLWATVGALSAPFILSAMIATLGSISIWLLLAIHYGSLICACKFSKRKPINRYVYAIFTLTCGIFTGGIVGLVTNSLGPNPVLIAFSMTSAIFLLLTCLAFFAKTDFSFLNSFITIGLGACLLGIVINWIFNVELVSLIISVIAVIACSANILRNTSIMLRTNDYSDPAGFALSLFISVYNVFISLIRILSSRSKNWS